jgi:IclR family pca regulon transcriptional regulator
MGRVLIASLPKEEFDKYLVRIELKSLTSKTVSDKAKFVGIIEKVRLNGYSTIDQELELGLRSIAVPVKTPSGRVVAAMNIGINVHRVPFSKMASSFLPLLRENALTLGRFLS